MTSEKYGVLVSMHDYNGGWWFKTLAEAQCKFDAVKARELDTLGEDEPDRDNNEHGTTF